MKTFEGAVVPLINDILERTIYVQELNRKIEKMERQLELVREELHAALEEIERLTGKENTDG